MSLARHKRILTLILSQGYPTKIYPNLTRRKRGIGGELKENEDQNLSFASDRADLGEAVDLNLSFEEPGYTPNFFTNQMITDDQPDGVQLSFRI